MNGIAWTLVALGIGVIVVRRRSIAVGLVTAQALVLAAAALSEGTSPDATVAATALALRGAVLAALFLFLVRRTRETRPVRAGVAPLARAAAAVALALTLIWLMPPFGLDSHGGRAGDAVARRDRARHRCNAPRDAVPGARDRARRERARARGPLAPGRARRSRSRSASPSTCC